MYRLSDLVLYLFLKHFKNFENFSLDIPIIYHYYKKRVYV